MSEIKDQHNYRVRIPWNCTVYEIETRSIMWRDASIFAMENFGLPGDKFSCRPLKESMEFWFEDERDALLFQLRWCI